MKREFEMGRWESEKKEMGKGVDLSCQSKTKAIVEERNVRKVGKAMLGKEPP